MQTHWHATATDALSKQLDTDIEHGLAQSEATRRLEQTGPNELRKGEIVSPLSIFIICPSWNNYLVLNRFLFGNALSGSC